MPAPIFVTRPFILTQLPQHLAEEFGSAKDYFHWLNNPPHKTQIVKCGIHPGTKLTKESLHCFLLSSRMKIMLCQFFYVHLTVPLASFHKQLPPTLKETPYCCLPALIMQQKPFAKNIDMVLKLYRWSSRPFIASSIPATALQWYYLIFFPLESQSWCALLDVQAALCWAHHLNVNRPNHCAFWRGFCTQIGALCLCLP